ncbi:MAG TPA: peptidylprolyl isomerase [Geobacteraceae bacterium]
MAHAKEGDKVKVHYTGKLEGGEIFDTSMCTDDGCGCDCAPLEFTIGDGEVIPGFEKAVLGMGVGETKTFTVPVDEAYGPRNEELVVSVERGHVPADMTPEVGMRLEVTQEDGSEFPVIITGVTDTHVTLDANHPLAGRDLTFDIELVEVG